ncbi:MAG TPA: 3-deoxy-D-manno-octulosonic acid transferase [Terracidiphilus sp.]|nr:3-deoxy-D-manno-octulosonic acid transferase [Terracidiphilus sp.]
MTLFFYNLSLLAALVAGAPWWLWRMATTHKYREGLGERLGFVPEGLRRRTAAPEDARQMGAKPVIWLHAVSVGEVLAVGRLVAELDRALPEFQLLISTTTRTGQALARERFGRDRVFYCPLDLPWAVRAYLNGLRPRLLILAETEFWPNLLSGSFRRGIPVAVVNARISDRSWPRYRRLRRWWRPLLASLAQVLAQSECDAERLRAIGCAANRVSVAGNLKFDVRAAEEAEATRQLSERAQGLRLVVAGSTLDGEESALLDVWPRLLEADPQLAMVIAPRHPERFATVAGMLAIAGVPWVARSSWRAEPHDTPQPLERGEVVLLDTIGELASVYSLAAVAFVGGSVVPAGGHNPLEPAQFAVPIVMGPNYANFRAIVDELIAHKALRIAAEGELDAVLFEILADREAARAMGERAREVFAAQAGATARCVIALRDLLGAGEPRKNRAQEQPA